MAIEHDSPRPTNRLADATSPYLLQHAHNPVDWYPWGAEALAKARAEDKPILLSVGYAACHWCHVMAHESFEDAATARIMNEHFVNIKVDREERPDIDSIYMTAVQAMTGGGGWPMTVFMTADGVPFYGGTYFPPAARHGMPAFSQVLRSVADAYRNRRADLLAAGDELVQHMRAASAGRLADGAISYELLDDAYAVLHGQFDPTYGGFGGAPKFPQPMTYEFLLRYAQRTGTALAWQMLHTTLRAMAEGGMYDQLGGGFHRYSVDERWLVPHFEKMLYDNALLARVYTEMFQATGEPFYRRIAEETLDYLVREMRHPAGGFFSTQDADSEGQEGKFFVWTPADLREILHGDALLFGQVFDVTERGNFEHKNILHVLRRPADVARVTGQPVARVEQLIARGRQLLLAARERRVKPARDEKVLAGWNGMALRAFAQAALAFGRADYRAVAEQNAAFVLRELRRADGTLLRVWKDDCAGTVPAYLDDHALLADGLLALYEATFEPGWLLAARELADTMLARFWDDAIGGFYDTAADHEALVVRPRDTGDNATPAGGSAAADVLLRLALIFDAPLYRERAATVLGSLAPFMARYPTGFGRYLAAAEFALSAPKEIALVGEPGAADTQALCAEIFGAFRPNKVVLLRRPGHEPPAIGSPLLADRAQIGGKATAYVCQNYACKLPVSDPAALAAQLD
ncbi:MAG: thioredoxin domain-containing protein [Kouleothrix sp.]|jgi:uncharacterized protein YyaL (SSP411 family)|nr:thioredoxin domain-containing protein [Kouleothrix sp.]